jgi:TRAP-type C4-dicarboxylate transport system permease small subunit
MTRDHKSAQPGGATPARLSFGIFTAGLSAIGTAWIFFMMVIICVDVVARGAFNAPILGVTELMQFSIVGIVFLQLAQTLRIGAMTRSDVLLGKLLKGAPRIGYGLQGLFHVTGAVMFGIIFRTTWPLMQQAFANDEFYGSTGVVQIPIGPLKIIILIGCATIAVQFLLLAWRDMSVALGRKQPPKYGAAAAP